MHRPRFARVAVFLKGEGSTLLLMSWQPGNPFSKNCRTALFFPPTLYIPPLLVTLVFCYFPNVDGILCGRTLRKSCMMFCLFLPRNVFPPD